MLLDVRPPSEPALALSAVASGQTRPPDRHPARRRPARPGRATRDAFADGVEAERQACALTPAAPAASKDLAAALGAAVKGPRVIVPLTQPDPLLRVEALIQALGG